MSTSPETLPSQQSLLACFARHWAILHIVIARSSVLLLVLAGAVFTGIVLSEEYLAKRNSALLEQNP